MSSKNSLSRMLADLEKAVKSRDEALVKELLRSKPPVHSTEGGIILWQAVLDDELEIASLLVRAGANLQVRMPEDPRSDSFLHVLVRFTDPRHHRLAVLMLDHGLDVNVLNLEDEASLLHAIKAQHSAIGLIKELLDRGARVNCTDIAEASRHPLAIELLPLLIGAGNADENIRHQRAFLALRYLPVHYADEGKILPVVKLLLGKFKLPEKYQNYDIFYKAIRANKLKVVQLLIEHGYDVRQKWEGMQIFPIHYASERASIDIIKLLVRHGADFNVTDYWHRTPLSLMPNPGYLSDKHQFALKNLAVSAAKGCAISDVNVKVIADSAEMKSFYEQCRQELELMKSVTFFNNVTFFSVLTSNSKRLSFSMRNDNFTQSYKDSPRNFPTFYNELEKIFEEAQERKDRLLAKELAFCEKLGDVIPYVPLEKIILTLYMDADA